MVSFSVSFSVRVRFMVRVTVLTLFSPFQAR